MPQKDRLFSLKWNNQKYKKMQPMERYRMRECVGTHYATGMVTLDTGAVYDTMSDLVRALDEAGVHTIVYHDEQQQPKKQRHTA